MAKRLESLLYVFLYLVIYVFSQLAAIVLIPLCNTIYKLINGETDFESLVLYFFTSVGGINGRSVVVLVASMAISVLLFIWVMKIRKRPWKKAILKKSIGFREITASVFLAYGLNVIAIEIAVSPLLERFADNHSSTINSIVAGDIYVVFLVVGVLAPIFEELMYRGVILNELLSGRRFFAANLLQALVFGIMHQNVIQGTYAAVLGFILGCAYKMTESIYMTMLTHFLFNASNLLVAKYINMLFREKHFITSGLLALVLAFILMSKLFRRKHKKADAF